MDAPDNTWRTLHITQACPNNDGMCAEDASTGGMRERWEVPGSKPRAACLRMPQAAAARQQRRRLLLLLTCLCTSKQWRRERI